MFLKLYKFEMLYNVIPRKIRMANAFIVTSAGHHLHEVTMTETIVIFYKIKQLYFSVSL